MGRLANDSYSTKFKLTGRFICRGVQEEVMSNTKQSQNDIAIIGMSGRFPGARDVAEFWHNLCQGTESLTIFSQDEIDAYLNAMDYAGAGLAEKQSNNPNYIRAGFVLDDIDMFDASFFGYNPSEAELIDPQHRIFLETAWQAFEDAGYDPAECDCPVGVFAGTSMSQYYTVNIFSNREIYYSERDLTALIGNEVDYLPTRVSYKLNLRGPSMSVQSACSSSMVAIHLACRSLLNHECDMALAGGSFVQVPQTKGYMYREGGLLSRDGHCRVFDAGASGTVFSNGGVGGVVLKRLGDAINDGDHIYAVVKGTAVDNDGSEKPAMTAPTVKGQMSVIKSALQVAGIEPHQISYVEAHGTGTLLGDPIEVSSLTHVFRETTDTRIFCGIGSLKTNVGHLDRVAGVAGFIKAAMALEHKQIPPSLNFDVPNPRIDFDNSPFYVNTELRPWDTDRLPRRVGVNSFGVGGTNAHAILEEAPSLPAADPGRQWQLLSVSARTPQALDAATGNLIDYLQNNPDRNLADIAYTLHCGRRDFSHRRIVAAENIKQAIELLSSDSPKQLITGSRDRIDRELTFMFSGQGSQYVNMGLELYQNEASFRQHMDACAELLQTYIGCDILEILYPASGTEQQATEKLKQTSITQPALFMIEYSLASLLMSWGIQPRAMIGHSIGEYIAACLAGVFDLESALRLVAKRGELMQQMPPGDMLAVYLPEQKLLPMLGSELSLAAINAPDSCVVSGEKDAIDNLELALSANISCQRLHTSHAFHSLMMEPILEPFIEVVKQIKLQPPQLPYLSNLTGTWITAEQATDPQYWADHLRNAVRFADGINTLVEDGDRLLLEVGPSHVLSSLARQSLADSNSIVLPTMHHPKEPQPAQGYLLQAIGRLWIAGGEIDWNAFYPERRHRLSMPTYPFERMRYWVEAKKQGDGKDLFRTRGLDDWFYLPYWKRMLPLAVADDQQTDSRWLLFADEQGVAEAIVDLLKSRKCPVMVVYPGERFVASGQSFNINPQSQDDYDQLVATLSDAGHMPDHVLHLWTLSTADSQSYEDSQNRGFYSLLYLAQAVGKMDSTNDIAITAVANGLHDVTGEESLFPQKASILGTCKVIPLEYPNIRCRSVDINFDGNVSTVLIKQLVAEASYDADDRVVAYRNNNRWLQDYENIQLPVGTPELPPLKRQGVYLITGGLGGIGLALAEYMASNFKAKLALTGRSALLDEAEWDAWLASHPTTDGNSEKIRKIRELRSLGAEVKVYSADVSNYQQMQNVVADIHDSFGAINGVIHTAGVAGGGMIQLKSHDMAERVLQPKIKGCLVLEQLLADDKLDLFVLCSSLFSVVGGIGQVDYCAANSFMDAFAQSRNGKNGEICVSINWDAWQDIGMAVKAMEQQQAPMIRQPLAGKDSGHPLLGVRTEESAERIIYSNYLGIDEQWVLAEHKIAGSNIVPGTGYLEWCRAAVMDSSAADCVEISDVLFMKPLEVQQQEQKACRLVLDGANGNYIVSIQSSSATTADGAPIWDEHFTARATAASRQNMDQLDMQQIRASCIKQSYDLKGRFPAVSDNWEDQGFIHFGSRWTNINQLHLGDRQALIELQLADEFAEDLAIYKLHPSLLDMATGPTIAPLVAGDDAWDGELYLPFSYEKLVWYAPLTKKIYSHVTYRSSEGDKKETLSQDVRIFDEDGRLLVEVEVFTLRKIHEGALKTQQQIDHDAVKA
ncbi:MAG TPA: SDR family NAD(P)-dependent oxidoreductase, partial [Gammaproteobacteria bacterium]|nr:SDR family NAD(P)-dependent oxidoreductase [Gammaproteobacteria bacterium]